MSEAEENPVKAVHRRADTLRAMRLSLEHLVRGDTEGLDKSSVMLTALFDILNWAESLSNQRLVSNDDVSDRLAVLLSDNQRLQDFINKQTLSASQIFERAAVELDTEATAYERNYGKDLSRPDQKFLPWDMLRKGAKWIRRLKGEYVLSLAEATSLSGSHAAGFLAGLERAADVVNEAVMKCREIQGVAVAAAPVHLTDEVKWRAIQAANRVYESSFRTHGAVPVGSIGAMRDAVYAALDAAFQPEPPVEKKA